jgi:D-3-phosphoglycerate dehydrogenase
MDCTMPGVTVAVLDTFHPQIEAAIAAAVPADWTVRFVDENSFAARVTLIRDADIVFVMAAPMPKEMLAEACRLRLIQKLGAGLDRIDLDFCRAQAAIVSDFSLSFRPLRLSPKRCVQSRHGKLVRLGSRALDS